MSTYIIAVKREHRDAAPDLVQRAQQIEGLTVQGSPTKGQSRIRVEATDGAIAQAKKELEPICYIEPVVFHHMNDSASRPDEPNDL